MDPLTMNHLLLGRNFEQKPCYASKDELTTGSEEFHQKPLSTWWVMWQKQNFPCLLSFYAKTDIREYKDLDVRDIHGLKFIVNISKYC